MNHVRLPINGHLVSGASTLPVIDPATEKILANPPPPDLAQINAVVARVTGWLPRVLLASAMFGAFAARAAAAEVIPPGAGLTTTLGAVNVSVYYRPAASGYETVVTAGTDSPGGVVRFVSTLAPGQNAVVSVPRGVGRPALELRLLRIGDRLELQHPGS